MPPVARYPTTSQGAVAILCPHRQALGARLGEHPILLGGGAVGVGDGVASRSLGTCLEGTATLAVGLGEVEQEGGTVGTDHLGAVDQDLSHPLGVTHEGSEAGGGDDLEHLSGAGGGGGLSPSLEPILQPQVPLSRVWGRNRDSLLTGTSGGGRGGGRRARLEVEPVASPYGLAGAVASVGVISATPHLVWLLVVSYHRKGHPQGCPVVISGGR